MVDARPTIPPLEVSPPSDERLWDDPATVLDIPMDYDRPVGSVSGTNGWQWNRWQAELRSRAGQPVAQSAGSMGRQRAAENPHVRSAVEIQARDHRSLANELERKERRLQHVIKQYERLLAERNRQLTEAEREEPTAKCLPEPLVTVIERVSSRY